MASDILPARTFAKTRHDLCSVELKDSLVPDEKITLVKNAVANVVRGSSSAIVALAVPPFLTRAMSPETYGVWALVLQLSAYVGYLDFGIQTAVSRFVAHANERGDADFRDRMVNTAFVVLTVAGALAVIALIAGAALMPRLFGEMPPALFNDARLALLLVGSSLAIGLPMSVFNGVFVGLQRNEVPAGIIATSRIISAVLLIVVVRHGGTIPQIAASMALVNVAAYIVQYVMFRRLAPSMRLTPSLASKRHLKELSAYCLSLTVWSFAMLLITGLNVTLVAHYQFGAVAYYSIAASLVTFIAGLQNAIFSAMIPNSAVLHARGATEELGTLLQVTSRYGMFLLLFTGLPLILLGDWVLRLWVGGAYAAHGFLLLQILIVANIIRLSMTPYSVLLVGTGQQRLVIMTPLLEGLTNLAVSVVLAPFYGAIGVAIGTLAGAVAGVLGHLLYNMRKTADIRVDVQKLIKGAILKPLVCSTPILAVGLVLHWINGGTPVVRATSFLFGCIGALVCALKWGDVGGFRNVMRHGTAQWPNSAGA
ncbi:MAG TPA: oligosaccharide flippase family protein [Clostridia bacterium]|nr:oligosaccharide flippase family protein [Clostridia bacterium]